MPTLASKNSCTGCSACKSICPRHAITMVPDSEGFLYPKVSSRQCVRCGLCEKVCPSLCFGKDRHPLRVLAVQAKDCTLREASSSGGVFSLLAQRIMERNGIVFGAALDPSDWRVRHVQAETEHELQLLRGSKYVQSEIGDSYQKVRDHLQAGRCVLFSGTPCQVGGLLHFLDVSGAKYDRKQLLLVDVVCHGAPSPFAWDRYLRCRKKAFIRTCQENDKGIFSFISFRSKCSGWDRYSMFIRANNGQTYHKNVKQDLFLRAFLNELLSRPSCFHCPARNLRSGSDIILADYWGVSKRFPEMNDDRGTSLVLATSELGCAFISDVLPDCIWRESDFAHAIQVNSPLVRSLSPNPRRKLFFRFLRWLPFDFLANQFLRPPVKSRLKNRFKRLVKTVSC